MKLNPHQRTRVIISLCLCAALVQPGCGGGGSAEPADSEDASQPGEVSESGTDTTASGEADTALNEAEEEEARPGGEESPDVATPGSSASVAAETTVAVPYALPTAGRAVAIGTNVATSVRPAEIGSFNWAYSLFHAYGTGSFVPDYSAAGAFVFAATGGHGVTPIVDAVLFDFSNATWKRVRNANGIAPRDRDYTTSETTGSPYYEIRGARAGQIPAPPHLYGLATYIPAARGGGSRGSYLKMGSPAVTAESRQVAASTGWTFPPACGRASRPTRCTSPTTMKRRRSSIRWRDAATSFRTACMRSRRCSTWT